MHTKKVRSGIQSHTRKLTRLAGGASFGIIIPKPLIRQLGWHEKQKVVITLKRRKIIVADWRKK
jgi:antitoxin component of MazEF toxin-antitoxin module